MRILAELRALYGPEIRCHICGLIIIDHRKTAGCCPYPKELHWLTADHVLPRSKGGSDSLLNFKPAHHSCNSRKQAKTEAAPVFIEDSTDFFKTAEA